jgi:hypothetical protein
VGSKSIVLELLNESGGAYLGPANAATIALIDNDRSDLVVTALTVPAQAATGCP